MFDEIVLNILLIMAIRFFLFDFYLFQSIWTKCKSKNNYFITHFLNCPFCQGFWIGFVYSLLLLPYGFFQSFAFGFITGFLNYTYYFLVYDLFYKSEELKMSRTHKDD